MLNKYIKCNIWRLAVRYDIYIYVIRRLKVKQSAVNTHCHKSLTDITLSSMLLIRTATKI